MSAFKVIADQEAPAQAAPADLEARNQAARWLVLSLQAVSMRLVTALALAWHTAFTAALVASAWWLWSVVLMAPDAHKLIGATIYSLFCLAVEWLRRAK